MRGDEAQDQKMSAYRSLLYLTVDLGRRAHAPLPRMAGFEEIRVKMQFAYAPCTVREFHCHRRSMSILHFCCPIATIGLFLRMPYVWRGLIGFLSGILVNISRL